jgi:hypothetical protein
VAKAPWKFCKPQSKLKSQALGGPQGARNSGARARARRSSSAQQRWVARHSSARCLPSLACFVDVTYRQSPESSLMRIGYPVGEPKGPAPCTPGRFHLGELCTQLGETARQAMSSCAPRVSWLALSIEHASDGNSVAFRVLVRMQFVLLRRIPRATHVLYAR